MKDWQGALVRALHSDAAIMDTGAWARELSYEEECLRRAFVVAEAIGAREEELDALVVTPATLRALAEACKGSMADDVLRAMVRALPRAI